MNKPATYDPTSTRSDSRTQRVPEESLPRSAQCEMTTVGQRPFNNAVPPLTYQERRPVLPPLADLGSLADRQSTSPQTTPPISRVLGHLHIDPFSRQNVPQPPSATRSAVVDARYQQSMPSVSQQAGEVRDLPWPAQQYDHVHDNVENPLKRAFGTMVQPPTRYPHPHQSHTTSTYPDFRPTFSPSHPTHFPASSRSSYSDASTASQTQSLPSFISQGGAREARPAGAGATTSRLSLHIRQQPRAARAGPDGKDRRAIDPPPVLQLMIDDFDLEDDDDMNEIRSSYFVVHCRLVSATAPKKDLSATQTFNEDGTVEVQRLLLGTIVASPFFCQDDPDPDNMPSHPVTSAVDRPPSPTSRFIQSRAQPQAKDRAQQPRTLPGSFFIFADLSVRKAGEYRLEFCLMKVEASSMMAGKNLPIIHTALSQVFKVVNAKDFDQVQPSTELVKGLLDRGAGFPLKLKKGIREGQRKRPTQDESEDDEDDDDEN